MTVLITGGAGFIGANFIFHMMRKYPDRRIICLDKLTYAGNIRTLDPVINDPRFTFVQMDICDRDGVISLFQREKPDVVVNFAAESHVDRSISRPEEFLRTNVLGTQVLLDACRYCGVSRFHQVSTDEVYGELPLNRPDLLFTEDSPLAPRSPYSSSKAAADLLVLAYWHTYGLPVTISRCSNNYGPYQFPEKLIPLMIVNGLSGKPLPVYGRGDNIRDWLYVEDHCEAIDLILQKGLPGQIYNIGGNNELPNIEVVRRICDILQIPHSRIAYVADRMGHDQRYGIDGSRIRSDFGWRSKVSFETGLAHTVRWYLDNRKWWMSLLSGKPGKEC